MLNRKIQKYSFLDCLFFFFFQKKVFAELAEHGIEVEEIGGNVQAVLISALKKKGA